MPPVETVIFFEVKEVFSWARGDTGSVSMARTPVLGTVLMAREFCEFILLNLRCEGVGEVIAALFIDMLTEVIFELCDFLRSLQPGDFTPLTFAEL